MKTTQIGVPVAILGNGIVHRLFVYYRCFKGTHFQRYALLFSDWNGKVYQSLWKKTRFDLVEKHTCLSITKKQNILKHNVLWKRNKVTYHFINT